MSGCGENDDVQRALSEWQLGFEAWWRDLERAGYTLENATFAAPIQVEGTLPTGERFYFRCRGGTCRLGVGGQDPVASPEWSQQFSDPGWSPFEAGGLSAEEARKVFEELIDRWRRR